MQVGDLVTDDFYEDVGVIVSGPRISGDHEHVRFGTMEGDVYEVVDILCQDGSVRMFTTDEIRVINESR